MTFIAKRLLFLLMHGDFNAKLGNWLINNTKTPEGAQIDSVTSLYGMENLISKQTDILQQVSSCIDLFSQNNPILPWITMQIHVYVLNVTAGNLLKNQFKNWVSSFLHPENLELQQTNLINRSIKNWLAKLFCYEKNVHQQVKIFDKTLPKIFHNYTPNKFILCDNNDPCWINQEIKSNLWIEKVSTLKFLTKENKNFEVLAFSIYSVRKLKYSLKVLALSLYSPSFLPPPPRNYKKYKLF